MRVSYQWLRELLEFPWTAEEIAEILTHLGLEVEAVEDWRGRYSKIVVGLVEEVRPHPRHDGLWICRVAVGGEVVQVIAGVAPRQGQRVAVALPGAVLPQLGESLHVRVFAGEMSQAMLCSRWELGLGEEADRIWELPENAPVGVRLPQYLPQLEDVCYEVALTPNRGDCASHLGIARELAAYGELAVHLPPVLPDEVHDTPVGVVVEASEGCLLYSCCLVMGVAAVASPLWMQLRLWRLGIRPHVLPVDVMNYVMLERGQPLHAFDFARVAQRRVLVRWAHQGELFTGLDGRTYELCPDDLLIADPEKTLALAGVLGGSSSQVTGETTDVLIESALFHPVFVRRAARRYGLETDAAYRFQRGVDPCGVLPALRRAASLLAELGGGQRAAPVIAGHPQQNSRRVLLRYDRVQRILGIRLPPEQLHNLVQRLGFRVEECSPQACTLRVPSFRNDVSTEVDVVEEIVRLYGYDRVPVSEGTYLPLAPAVLPDGLRPPELYYPALSALVEWGFQQVITPVLIDPDTAQQWEPNPVRLVNALGLEYSALRPSLVPSLMRVIAHNVRVGERTVRIFELGKVFRQHAGSGRCLEDYEERFHLAIALSGAAAPLQWGVAQREVDLYDLRGLLEQLLERLRIPNLRWAPWTEGRLPALLPVALRIFSGEQLLGWIGQLRPRWLKVLEVEQPVFVAVLDGEAMHRCMQPATQRYVPVPEYPAIRRDIAFVVDAAVPVSLLSELIRSVGGEWLEEVTLFDVFASPAIGAGKRSLAFALRFRSRERTLREEDIIPLLDRIVVEVERQTGAQLRR
ncbi:MAG: phenylalanine--tRNA ligase subunit beta [Bacteroidota bacterium]|nr:phenylalanine--tRNA ligase subunit beta [Bacteroidota bacterium]